MIICLLSTIIIISLLILSAINNCMPWNLFRSCLTNTEFKNLLELMFNDSTLHTDSYSVYNSSYKIWYCNGYGYFSINDIYSFSFYQKYLFYKRFNQYKIQKNLHKHTLSDAGKILYGKK